MDAVFLADFRKTVDTSAARLRTLSSAEAAVRPAPGSWSPKEIIGHLVDSASNNHGRFVRAQLEDDLVFPGYDGDAWVRTQRYASAPWTELVGLWRAYNLQLARVVDAMSEDDLTRPRENHNLDKIASDPVPRGESTTLAYFVRDYIGHLELHVRQIVPEYVPVSS